MTATDKPAKSGPHRALERLGLLRDIDLALHLPLRWEDETRIDRVADATAGAVAQVEGDVRDCRVEQHPRRQLLVRLADGSGELRLRFVHFYPSQQKLLAVGRRIRARGDVRCGFDGPEMVHPVVRPVAAESAASPLPTTLTPVYPAGAQLPQAYLRAAIAAALARAPLHELLPGDQLPAGLMPLAEALRLLHHPPAGTPIASLEDRSHPAWRRLQFDELLAQQLSQLQAHVERAARRAPVLDGGDLPRQLRLQLPFALTAAQERVVAEIGADLRRPQPMHRLLQGDVGSGKTVVAALAALAAVGAGWQCALMAPTEILAEQHFRKLVTWLQPLGLTVAWLTGSRKGRGRRQRLAQVASGEAALVVGTHAVIQHEVAFARLGLAIVDEQHRFGVAQRLALRAKLAPAAAPAIQAMPASAVVPVAAARSARSAVAPVAAAAAVSAVALVPAAAAVSVSAAGTAAAGGASAQPPPCGGPHAAPPAQPCRPSLQLPTSWPAQQPPGAADAAALQPHLLMMSATPIPRTLAMTYFADVDVSTIDELPPGRTPVLTKVFADGRRADVVARVRQALSGGGQAYWVCPLVEESEHVDLQNATATHAELTEALPGCRVGLLHGRMPPAEKAAVMAQFDAGAVQLLVATTVIEVGVDVPNASLMVVEHAERFGLAQLHQLRGRVGRGAAASVCVLLYSPPLSATGKARLRAMSETNDGFEIARRDLDIRGPGEFMGARQSGDALLRFADLDADGELLQLARATAERLLQTAPDIAARHVQRWLGERAKFADA